MFGLKSDWSLDVPPRYYTLDDYEGALPRWCPGCGDLGVLTAVQRICRDKQIAPEKTVCVSGIGCSSRFPHYMKTYGFHGLHGRALPVASGIKSRRPELDIWVATGDGDCCSIGAGHWIHAIRYNMDMVVMLLDNSVYGLTKKQTSPTSPVGMVTNTHPKGAFLPPLNPLVATLGFTNCSFVAQTVDWNPVHLHATLQAAHDHKGLSFVRIVQRCPAFLPKLHEEAVNDPSRILYLEHDNGVAIGAMASKIFTNRREHDPSDMNDARAIAQSTDVIPIGLLYQDQNAPRYCEHSAVGLDMPVEQKVERMNRVLDQFAI